MRTTGCFRHGMTRSREYYSWQSATDRCYNHNNPQFHDYGGRGITMSDAGRRDFMAFHRDMGPRPLNQSLDRIDNNGPYTGPCTEYPQGNCRWTTQREQCANMRKNILVEVQPGTHVPLREAAR